MTCAWVSPALRVVFTGRLTTRLVLSTMLCATAMACARDAVVPVAADPAAVATFRPARATQASAALCATAPDLVVSTEAALRNAVATAAPGSTIAIDGMIFVSGRAIVIERSDLHLSCSTPGAGLQGDPINITPRLLDIRAPRVSVTGLRLDAQSASDGAVMVQSVPSSVAAAADVMLAGNDMTCGPDHCVFLIGTPRAVIARNRMAPAEGRIIYCTLRVTGVLGQAVAEDVTLTDNDMTCGYFTCAIFFGTPRAMIARNRMVPAVGIDSTYALIVVAGGVPGSGRESMTAEDVTVTDNDLTVGWAVGAIFEQAPRAVITRNRVVASKAVSGLHLQFLTDGTRIEQNTITALGPSRNPTNGGIRVSRGRGVVVNDNIVTGPWWNGITVANQIDGEIARNDVRGATQYGISIGVVTGGLQDRLSVRNNKVTGAGYAGMGVDRTCRSEFVGNNLNGNARGAEFFLRTGANTLHGNGTIVFDNGAWDCDGDGTLDPNVISGAKGVHKGPPLGPVTGDAASRGDGAMK